MIQQLIKGITRLPHVLSRTEKLVVIGLLIVALGTSGLWWKTITDAWPTKPLKGGIYSEGLLAYDTANLDLLMAKLTKIGLTYVNHKQEIKGALAERWEISPDGKTYTFYLRPAIKAEELAHAYGGLPEWQNIQVKAGDQNTLTFTLKQPFSPLIYFTSDPVIEAGPYKLDKETATEIVLAANPSFVLGEPNLEKIVLSFYPDERSLKAALQRQEVLGADQAFTGVNDTVVKKLRLTKQTVLFFNLDQPFLKDKKNREMIRDKQRFDKEQSLTLATSQDPDLIKKANQFAEEQAKLGIKIAIKSLNPIILERDILAKRNYDLFLTTINYGYDEDPYPYWHSSQLIPPGKNYANYNSKEGDQRIEEARQTLDPVERKKKIEEFQNILEADIPAIFYPNEEFSYTISRRIKGVNDGMGVLPSDRYTEVWQWHIKQKKEAGS